MKSGNRRQFIAAGPALRRSGLTLLEILVVLAILAIIASIAVPSYREHLERGRRTDAMIALQDVAARQEQFYFDHNRYSASLASIGASPSSPDGYYRITLLSESPVAFIARAEPAAGRRPGSGPLEIRSDGAKRWDRDDDGVFECSWISAVRAGGRC